MLETETLAKRCASDSRMEPVLLPLVLESRLPVDGRVKDPGEQRGCRQVEAQDGPGVALVPVSGERNDDSRKT